MAKIVNYGTDIWAVSLSYWQRDKLNNTAVGNEQLVHDIYDDIDFFHSAEAAKAMADEINHKYPADVVKRYPMPANLRSKEFAIWNSKSDKHNWAIKVRDPKVIPAGYTTVVDNAYNSNGRRLLASESGKVYVFKTKEAAEEFANKIC